jgi:hypothetical protein
MKEANNSRIENDHNEQVQKSFEINHSETAMANTYSEHCLKGSDNMFLVESKPVPKSQRHFSWTRPGNEKIQNSNYGRSKLPYGPL